MCYMMGSSRQPMHSCCIHEAFQRAVRRSVPKHAYHYLSISQLQPILAGLLNRGWLLVPGRMSALTASDAPLPAFLHPLEANGSLVQDEGEYHVPSQSRRSNWLTHSGIFRFITAKSAVILIRCPARR